MTWRERDRFVEKQSARNSVIFITTVRGFCAETARTRWKHYGTTHSIRARITHVISGEYCVKKYLPSTGILRSNGTRTHRTRTPTQSRGGRHTTLRRRILIARAAAETIKNPPQIKLNQNSTSKEKFRFPLARNRTQQPIHNSRGLTAAHAYPDGNKTFFCNSCTHLDSEKNVFAFMLK